MLNICYRNLQDIKAVAFTNKKTLSLFLCILFLYCYWLTNIKAHCKFFIEAIFCQLDCHSYLLFFYNNLVYLLQAFISLFFFLFMLQWFPEIICQKIQSDNLKRYEGLPLEVKQTVSSEDLVKNIQSIPCMVTCILFYFISLTITFFLSFNMRDQKFEYKKFYRNGLTYPCIFNLIKDCQISSTLNLTYLIIVSILLIIAKFFAHIILQIWFLKNELHTFSNLPSKFRAIIYKKNKKLHLQKFLNIVNGTSNILLFILINKSAIILKFFGFKIEDDLLQQIAQLCLSIILCNFVFSYIDDIKLFHFIRYSKVSFILANYRVESNKRYICPLSGDLYIETKQLTGQFEKFSNLFLYIKKGDKVAIVGEQTESLLYLMMGKTAQKNSKVLFDSIPVNEIYDNSIIQFIEEDKNPNSEASLLFVAEGLIDSINLQNNKTIIFSDKHGKYAKNADLIIFISKEKIYIDNYNSITQNNQYKEYA